MSTVTLGEYVGNPRRLALCAAAVALILGVLAPAGRSAPGPVAAAGFTDELVTNAPAPTALAFLPDGQMLIATQPGRLHLQRGPGLLGPVVLDLTSVTCSNLERGLLGVAVDPDFATRQALFVFYTADHDGVCGHRVSRFELEPGGVTVRPGSERVLIDNIPSPNANHNGGDLAFGPDGTLYITVGDGGCDYEPTGFCAGGNNAARDEHILLGKILRITRDGGVPPDNPFLGPDADRCALGATTPGRRCQETYAWGFRNPFRLAFDPTTPGRFYINDVGQHAWEEINEGAAGADYGWNIREGECPNASTEGCGPAYDGLTDPVFSYSHDDCGAITGGAFVPAGAWPPDWDGAYLFGDYNCGVVFRLRADPASPGGHRADRLLSGAGPGGPVHLAFGPAGDASALYYTSYANGGEVRRLTHTGDANRAPTVALAVNRVAGDAPLKVKFDASGSADPDGDGLRWRWDFGDGSPVVETEEPKIEHRYRTAGVHEAKVVARDARGAESLPAAVRIGAGRRAPRLEVSVPDAEFTVGRPLPLSARATDEEDGPLGDDAVSWTLLLHHDEHTHPYLGPVTGSQLEVLPPEPESLPAAATSYLELRVTATDSDGLTTTVVKDLRPRRVTVALRSDPSGLDLVVNGVMLATPAEIVAWVGWELDVEARGQTRDGVRYRFADWSDGGGARHRLVTPAGGLSLTARFVPEAP